jgi:protein-disulfide isomerase
MNERFGIMKLMGIGMALLVCACKSEHAAPVLCSESDAGTVPVPVTALRRGADPARVVVVEFADFECPYCGVEEPTVKRVLDAYPNDVALAFVNFPLGFHKYALGAAYAFLAAGRQGKAWEMHDQMFAHQQALSDVDLHSYAAILGLDIGQFDADRASPEIANQVEQDKSLGISLGVSGTPSFAIDCHWLVGAQPFEAFTELINQSLGIPAQDASADVP